MNGVEGPIPSRFHHPTHSPPCLDAGRLGASDNAPPVISMIGLSVVQVAQFSTYSDLGATASDSLDGNIPRQAGGSRASRGE